MIYFMFHDCPTFNGNIFISKLQFTCSGTLLTHLKRMEPNHHSGTVLLKPCYSSSAFKIPKYNQLNKNPFNTSYIFLTTMKTLLIKKQYFEYSVSDSQKGWLLSL